MVLFLSGKESRLFFRAINKALEKPSPGSIPLAGPRSLENDFYSVHLEDNSGKDQVWLKAKTDHGYEALVRTDGDSGKIKTLNRKNIESFKYKLRIDHYYKDYQFHYRSPLRFFIAYYCRWHLWIIFRDRFSQKRFNRKPLIRAERMELLQYLVERSIQRPREKFDPLFLGLQLYSRKWFYHPEKDEHKEHLKLLLESFVESGDLKRQDGGYTLSGKALETLANHDLEQQKHQDNLATAKVGNRLTWAIVLIGMLDILVQLK